ncbi:MAG: flagellar hook-associated protein FlgK [bacterium]
MSSIMGAIYVGLSGLSASQVGLEITEHNIVNANRDEYSRQRVNLEVRPSYRGVEIDSIIRDHDEQIEKSIRENAEYRGQWEAKKDYLGRIETIFNEVNDQGLSDLMNAFWNSWQDLGAYPENQTQRNVVREKGSSLCSQFNQMSAELKEIISDANEKVGDIVIEINKLVDQIVDVNKKIAIIRAGGDVPNDLRDTRDKYIMELAKFVDITAFETDNGMVSILLNGGLSLVDGQVGTNLSLDSRLGDLYNRYDIYLGGRNVTNEISNGELGGLIEIRDITVPGYMTQLDELAASIITQVNDVHSTGFGLNGATDINFFEPFIQSLPGDNSGAATSIHISSAINNDLNNIVAAQDNVSGDGRMAIRTSNLSQILTMSSGFATFGDYYNTMIASIGSEMRTAQVTVEHGESMFAQINKSKAEVSGVSIDEEVVKMVVYQKSYQASARCISILDELLSLVANGMGLGG